MPCTQIPSQNPSPTYKPFKDTVYLTSLLWCSRNNPEEEEGEKEDDISHGDSTTSEEGARGTGNPPNYRVTNLVG